MTRARAARWLAAPLLVGALSGCVLEDFIDLGSAVDLTQSEDPHEQAAGRVAAQAKAVETAETALDAALESGEVDELDAAIEARPYDPRYLAYKGSLLIASGASLEQALEDGFRPGGRLAIDDDGISSDYDDSVQRWHETMIDAASATFFSFPDGSDEQERLRGPLCNMISTYGRDYALDADALFFLALTPDVTCDDAS